MPDLRYISRNLSETLENLSARTFGQDKVDLPKGKFVSFNFDDFPQSAVRAAAPMLEAKGWRATWYVCGELIEQVTPEYGAMYTREDLRKLIDAGHDIGCHTFSHTSVRRLSEADLLADCQKNADFLDTFGVSQLSSFAFPFGATQLGAKAALARSFPALRSVRPGVHVGELDLKMLKATALQEDQGGIARALSDLRAMPDDHSWLIIFTHDVREGHSPWGVTPDDFETLLEAVVQSGAAVVTVADMVAKLRPAP
ncbi:MAG: polysaccharide deacetylase family protein [Henriciella sp.]|nr:polysaccharide deacetylase family protein [Henriciella sp.]